MNAVFSVVSVGKCFLTTIAVEIIPRAAFRTELTMLVLILGLAAALSVVVEVVARHVAANYEIEWVRSK